jgi:hypothetical protein
VRLRRGSQRIRPAGWCQVVNGAGQNVGLSGSQARPKGLTEVSGTGNGGGPRRGPIPLIFTLAPANPKEPQYYPAWLSVALARQGKVVRFKVSWLISCLH